MMGPRLACLPSLVAQATRFYRVSDKRERERARVKEGARKALAPLP